MAPNRRSARKPPIPKKRGHAAPKPTVDQFLTLHSRFNKAGTDFLKVDLETALTFSGLALQTEDGTKRARNRRAARRAFDTIVRLLERVQLSEAETNFFGRNLWRLKSELKELGERF